MPGKDAAGKRRHLILVRQEPLAGVDDALLVVAYLERDDRPDVQRDALLGDALLGDLCLAHGQCQVPGLAEEGGNESAVSDDDLERRPTPARPATRYQHRLVWRRYPITEHLSSPVVNPVIRPTMPDRLIPVCSSSLITGYRLRRIARAGRSTR